MKQSNAPDRSFDYEKVEEKLKQVKSLEDLTGPGGVIQEMVKGTVERILKAEQEAHLGYEAHHKDEDVPDPQNSRNGYSKKRVKTAAGGMEIEVPRDRKGTFDPKFIKKHQSFDPDLERRITSMYARGMSVRDITEQLSEFYGTDVSPALISKVTDKVLEGAAEWQARPLESVYAVVFMDAIHYKIRQDGKVITKAAYTCLGIDLDGHTDVLGIWVGEAEGAHFWLNVLTELKARGVEDILIACVDGLKGFPDAIEQIFPRTDVQLCIVHQIRASLRYLSYQHRREFLADIKEVYRAPSLETAETAFESVKKKWRPRSEAAVQSWERNWVNLTTYFQYPAEIRKMIYTTNAVEALHRQFRKVTKAKSVFPTDDSLRKMLYLATLDLRSLRRKKHAWPTMLAQLQLIYGERIPLD